MTLDRPKVSTLAWNFRTLSNDSASLASPGNIGKAAIEPTSFIEWRQACLQSSLLRRMTDLHDLSDVADLIIRRVLAEATDETSLAEALNRANPFGEDPYGKQLWLEAILRNAYNNKKLLSCRRLM